MARNRITKRDIDALRCKPGEERAFLWDGETRGFGVVAFKSGKKIFVAQYRLLGRSHRVNIGAYGTMMLDDFRTADDKPVPGARTIAQGMLSAARLGDDPIKSRREAAAVRTFKEVAEEFLQLHLAKKKHNTRASYRQVLERHVYPAIGSKRMDSITKNDVMKRHAKLSEIPYAANRCLSVISSVWNWAAERGERAVTVQNNPAKVKRSARYTEQAKERFLSPEELSNLGDALRRAETVGLPWTVDESNPKAKHARKNRIRLIDKHAVAAIRLLILTGARLREILNAKWDYVDFDRGIMFLPDSKTGKKPIYLSAAALAVLNEIPRTHGNPYLIPGEKRPRKRGEPKLELGPRADLKRPWEAVARAAGFFETVTEKDANGKSVTVERSTVRLHDLRHSFASVGAGASLGLPVIGKLLGHSNTVTTQRYAHLDADPLKRAAETIGGQIAAAMAGRKAEVVPFPAPAKTA